MEIFFSPVNGGIDAKELFDSYIILWIQDKRLDLLEFCKQDRVIHDVQHKIDFSFTFLE